MPHDHPYSGIVTKLCNRRVTVFVGAGVSVVPPSCLPSWRSINHAVLDVIGGEAGKIVPQTADLVEKIKARQDAGKFPPEFTSNTIVEQIGEQYFEVLGCLEGTRPNRVHRYLAALAKAGRLPAIVTTNFDTLIERACLEAGVPLNVIVDPADFSAVAIDAQIADPSAPTLLVKLHGTATRPTTCIDTLAQRKKGFPAEVERVLQGLVKRTEWAILGYSGADLEAEPNYLFLRQFSDAAPGFEWLFMPDSNPSPAVLELIDRYGPTRAKIVRGRLPEWLDQWAAALDGTDVAPPPADGFSAAEVAEFRRQTQESVSSHSAQWASDLGPVSAGLILGELGKRSGFDAEAIRAMRVLSEYTAEHMPKSRRHAVCQISLAHSLMVAGDPRAANELYQQAVQTFIDLEDLNGFGGALNDYSMLLVDLGHYDAAQRYLEEAIRIATMFDEPDSVLRAKLDLAEIAQYRGQPGEAARIAREAAEMARRIGYELDRARSVERLAVILTDIGEPDEALAYLRDAQAVYERLGNDRGLAYNLLQQSAIFADWGKIPVAVERIDRAEGLAERVGVKALAASIANSRGNLFMSIGDFDKAEAGFLRAVQLRREIGDRKEMLVAQGNLIALYVVRNHLDKALELGHDALQAANEFGLPGPIARVSSNYAMALEAAGNLDEARQFYETALAAHRDRQDVRAEAMVLGNLGNIALRQENMARALESYDAAMQIFDRLNDAEGRIRTLANLGLVKSSSGDTAGAIADYEKASALAVETGIAGTQALISFNLANAYWVAENFSAAAEHFGVAHDRFAAQGDLARAGETAYFRAHSLARIGDLSGAIHAAQSAIGAWQPIGHDNTGAAIQLLSQLETHLP